MKDQSQAKVIRFGLKSMWTVVGHWCLPEKLSHKLVREDKNGRWMADGRRIEAIAEPS